MRTAAAGLLFLSLFLALFAAAGEQPLSGHMPLVFYDYGIASRTQEPAARPATVTIGRLPAAADTPRITFPTFGSEMREFPGSLPPGGNGALIRGIVAGDIEILHARPDDETLLILSGPVLNSGELWQPTALERQANTFTLSVETWTDNGARLRNIPGRNAFIMSLGRLPTGDYTLIVRMRNLLWDYGLGRQVYSVTKAGAAEGIRFSVAEGAGDGPADVFEIDNSKLKQAEHLQQLLYQRRRCLTTHGRPAGVPKLPYVQVGTFDFAKWVKEHDGIRQLPDVAPHSLTGPIYVVIFAGSLNSYEWLSLGEVAWRENEATIRIDVWRDTGAREKNVPFHPLMVVPLNMPVLQVDGKPLRMPGDYKVTVEWRLLLAKQPGGFYVEQDARKTQQIVEFTLE